MTRWRTAGLAAGVIVAAIGLAPLATAISSHDSGSGETRSVAWQHEASDRSTPTGRAQSGDRSNRRGHGPPPWAHGPKSKTGKSTDKPWKTLTPEQRETMMKELARQHADGMQRWAACVAAGRSDCVRPLPPGQAKRQ